MKGLTSNNMTATLCYKKVLRKLQCRSFSLTSCFFKEKCESNKLPQEFSSVDELSIEINSSCLPPVPKKTYGLSKVEEKDVELVESLKRGNIFYPYKNPYERCRKILAEGFKCEFRKLFYHLSGVKLGPFEPVYFPRHTDILIIGGGILGLTIAYTLKEKFPYGMDVIVVDKDSNFPPLSTNLSQGIVTNHFFTDEEEIPMLKYGAEFLSSFPRRTEVEGLPPFKMPYEPLGSLLLVDNSNVNETLKRIDSLKRHDIYNKILDKETLMQKFPWLDCNDILFASLGMTNEGIVDPWAYMHGLKGKCVSLGIKFVNAEVIDFGFTKNALFRVACKLPDGTYNSIDFCKCILACGMEALNLVKIINSSDKIDFVIKLPLHERLKYEFCFYNPEGPGLNTPMVIDSSGAYLRREGLGGYYVAGIAPMIFNDSEENDPYHIFQTKVKPFLTKRISSFKKIQVVRGWANLQEHCFSNDIGILGRHPQVDNIMFALGFSHLGLQYMPALARAVMENILYEDYQTINFTSFHLENLWQKQHLEAEKRKAELLKSKKRVAISN